MRITQFIPSFGRQMTIVGCMLLFFGFVVQFYQADWTTNINTTTLVIVLLMIVGIIGGIYLYQRLVFAKRLRNQILRAQTITTAPTQAFQKLPGWLWLPILIFTFTIAACTHLVALLFGAILIGFGLSVPTLMKIIHDFESNGAQYYGQRNTTNGQFEIMRYVPSATESDA